MTTDENKRICRRVLDELFDQGDFDALEELIHPDFINHEAPPGHPQGREGLKTTVTWLGKEPTGKAFAAEHIHIWRLQDGMVIEHWSVRDDLNHALQLGLIGD